ncbi:hypothetical protein D9M68_698930 [compost metagenome]
MVYFSETVHKHSLEHPFAQVLYTLKILYISTLKGCVYTLGLRCCCTIQLIYFRQHLVLGSRIGLRIYSIGHAQQGSEGKSQLLYIHIIF